MIAADTSSLIAYLSGEAGADAEQVDAAMEDETLVLPPPVLAELCAKPNRTAVEIVARLPLIEITDGYWERAGEARRVLLGQGLKAAMLDALIAQACIDADVPLIARDRDYRHFERWCGLKLA